MGSSPADHVGRFASFVTQVLAIDNIKWEDGPALLFEVRQGGPADAAGRQRRQTR